MKFHNKINYIIFSLLLFCICVGSAMASATPNGIEIIENESENDNTFALYCSYYNGSYILIYRSSTDDSGNIEPDNALIKEASNSTLKQHNFMDSNGSLDCPKYVKVNIATQEIIGYSNSSDGGINIASYGLNTSISSCTGKCVGNQSSSKESGSSPISTSNISGENFSICEGNFGAILKQTFHLIKFAVPIIIIGLGIADFVKALSSQKQDELKKAANKLVQRLIIGTVIFVLPTIIDFLLEIAGVTSSTCGW